MSKIIRPIGEVVFAKDSFAGERTVFGGTAASDALNDNLTVEYGRGWGVVGEGGVPTYQDFNAALYTATKATAYLYQQGVAEYSATQTYYNGSVCQNNGELFICQADDTVGIDTTDTTKWQSVKNALVRYDAPQTLTTAQQAQARANIGAGLTCKAHYHIAPGFTIVSPRERFSGVMYRNTTGRLMFVEFVGEQLNIGPSADFSQSYFYLADKGFATIPSGAYYTVINPTVWIEIY